MSNKWTELIAATRRNNAVLSGLNSNSQTAEFRQWEAVIGSVMYVFDQARLQDQTDINTIIEANRGVGTAKWYVQRALEFQWSSTASYSLIVDDDGYARYPVVVLQDRIIKQAAATTDQDGKLILKVATTNSQGELIPLTTEQLQDFKNYISSLALPGQPIQYVNQAADILTVVADVYYSSTSNSTGLHDALMEALRQFSLDTEFNGRVYLSAIVDALQSVPGIIDVYINSATLTDADNIITHIERVSTAKAGYFNIGPDTNITLKIEE